MGQFLEQYRGVLFLILIVLALLGIIAFLWLRSEPPSPILIAPTSSPLPETTATPRPLRVYVSGAVQHPDVYLLAPESIVKDALLAAGGPASDADLDRINLAMPVADSQHIYVPRTGEDNPPIDLPSTQSTASGQVNINTADPDELDSLPGIGPSIAQRICAYRENHGPFTQIEDIMEVSGIGPATFEKIRDLITTR
jgi:competence protein ComEA